MATRILEFGGTGHLGPSFPVVPAGQRVTVQSAMTATSTSAQSAAVNAATSLVCVQSDEQIYVLVASNPTVTNDNYRIPAGGEQWFSLPLNSGWKVAIKT
jgi:hypothetical protein